MAKPLANRNHFNHAFLIQVEAAISPERLTAALEQLNRHHDLLRAVYRHGQLSCRQESRIAELRTLDRRGRTEPEIHAELTSWQDHFSLEDGYLWQAGIIRGYEDGSERIFIAMHHLVFDAASWPILREDLKQAYDGQPLAARISSYRQWVEAVAACGSHAQAAEREHWEAARSGMEPQRGEWDQRACGTSHYSRIDLSEVATQTLLAAGKGQVHELLLSGLSYALQDLTGRTRHWITLERQGREAIDPRIDVSRTLGWFTTLFPLCLIASDDLAATIAGNRTLSQSVPGNGIGYGALHGYDRLPAVLFNYLEELGGLDAQQWPIRFGEDSGEGMDPANLFGNVVEINGLTAGGRIRLGLESWLSAEDHARLCTAFQSHLERIATFLAQAAPTA